MKITICGSIAFIDQMIDTELELEKLGHEVQMPPAEIANENGTMMPVIEYYKRRKAAADSDLWAWDTKQRAMKWHFDKVAWADSILVLNYDKNDIAGYIGANTLLEMGLAMHLNKPIYLLNDLPQISYREELLGMKPIIIHNDLTNII